MIYGLFVWKNLFAVGATFLLGIGALFAHPQRPENPPPRPPRNPVELVQEVLADANAPALSEEQKQQLAQLFEARRAHPPAPPPDTQWAARQAYDNAILAGNLSAANTQAEQLARQISADEQARLQAAAKFKIAMVGVFKTNEAQMNALMQRFGTAGLTRLLNELERGPRPAMPPPPPRDGRGPDERL